MRYAPLAVAAGLVLAGAHQAQAQEPAIAPEIEIQSPQPSTSPTPPKVLKPQPPSIQKVLHRFSTEPSLSELKQAALRYQDADLDTASRWRSAPNRAAMLPTVKVVFAHDLERDESLDRYQDEPDRWGADTDRDLGVQVWAQWRLDELIFNADEVRVWHALADRASRREAVLMSLVGYYFERRKLQIKQMLEPPIDLVEQVELTLRITELTAALDALTGGYFSRAMKAHN
ncbi:MAG: hypothetical protein QNJ97_19395 [Myxococcota bacterium]|nr:hypothetical protein [Myxococcota bacterium]